MLGRVRFTSVKRLHIAQASAWINISHNRIVVNRAEVLQVLWVYERDNA